MDELKNARTKGWTVASDGGIERSLEATAHARPDTVDTGELEPRLVGVAGPGCVAASPSELLESPVELSRRAPR